MSAGRAERPGRLAQAGRGGPGRLRDLVRARVLLAGPPGAVVAIGALVTHPLNSVIAAPTAASRRPVTSRARRSGPPASPSDRPLLDAVVRTGGGDPGGGRDQERRLHPGPRRWPPGKVDAVIGAYWNIELVELERQGVPARAFRLEENGVPTTTSWWS